MVSGSDFESDFESDSDSDFDSDSVSEVESETVTLKVKRVKQMSKKELALSSELESSIAKEKELNAGGSCSCFLRVCLPLTVCAPELTQTKEELLNVSSQFEAREDLLFEAQEDAVIADVALGVRNAQLESSVAKGKELSAGDSCHFLRVCSPLTVCAPELTQTKEELLNVSSQFEALEDRLFEAREDAVIADVVLSVRAAQLESSVAKAEELSAGDSCCCCVPVVLACCGLLALCELLCMKACFAHALLCAGLKQTKKENGANKKQLDGANKKLLHIYKGRAELSNKSKEQVSHATEELRKERAVMIAELSQGRAANAEQLSQMESSCRAERAAKLEMLANMEHELKTIRPGQTHLTKDQENLFGQMVSIKKAAAPDGPIKAPNIKPGATMAHGPEVTLMPLTSKYKNSADLKSAPHKRERAKLGEKLQEQMSTNKEDSADVKRQCIVAHVTQMVKRNKEAYREVCTNTGLICSKPMTLDHLLAMENACNTTNSASSVCRGWEKSVSSCICPASALWGWG